MSEKYSFPKKLFLSFMCLLVLMGAITVLIQQIGNYIQTSLPNPVPLKQAVQIGSILFFAIVIYFLRKVPFKKIFKGGLILIALALIASLLYKTPATYFILTMICPKVLFVLGWAYINQITSPLEGKKYYFALNFVVGLALAPFSMMPILIKDAPLHLILLLAMAIVCLGLVTVCDRWILNKAPEKSRTDSTPTPRSIWVPVVALAVLLAGLNLAAILTAPSFKTQIKTLADSAAEYSSLMGKHSIMVGVSGFAFLILSLIAGPKLLQRKGWTFSMLIAPVLGAVGILALIVAPLPWAYTFHQGILKGLEYAWVFPLVQIAFLSYSLKSRFFLQAYVFLVASPLLEWGAGGLKVSSCTAPIASLFLMGLMAAAALIMAKNNKSLAGP